MRFTQTTVQSVKADPNKKQFLTDDTTKGLTLYVGKTGVKVWYYYFRDADGKKASRKLGDADVLSVAQAREMVKKFGGKVAQGESIRKEKPIEKVTLGAFLNDAYFPWVKINRKSGEETAAIIRAAFGKFFAEPIEDMTLMGFESWRTKRLESGSKASTVNRLMTALKAAINWGYYRELLPANPLAKLKPLKESDSEVKVRYLTAEERERLETALVEREAAMRDGRDSGNQWRADRGYEKLPVLKGEFADYLRPIILLSLNTGIRRGNIFSLVWGDIDFGSQSMTLRGEDSKSGKTIRVPINDDAAEILSIWRGQSTHADADDLVFPSPKTGKRLDNLNRSWESILKSAQIENFRWHDMRHDFASQLVMRGVDLNVVRELMGHSDLKMTMRYAHLAPKQKLDAVQALNRRARGSKIIGTIPASA